MTVVVTPSPFLRGAVGLGMAGITFSVITGLVFAGKLDE